MSENICVRLLFNAAEAGVFLYLQCLFMTERVLLEAGSRFLVLKSNFFFSLSQVVDVKIKFIKKKKVLVK